MSSIEEEILKLDQQKDDTSEVKPTIKPLWYRIIFADSSTKNLEEFTNHPLNYDNKPSTGRIVKGLEGMMGSLDKAVVDLLVGIVQKLNEAFEGSKNE